ncbi:hypothetical protein H9W90_10650 [Polaribacter pectinis]|uniref:Uncharacterized protein n=1 Tax=Polaribacter pectinis TaxID=2738844 RepID=A0A7G9L7Q6_9FLAO|nr:hypothetical protein [Polaribacter pectinis]QNM84655.1 hypothetical protein H9W90_10650 [Polaribacter pectinis]
MNYINVIRKEITDYFDPKSLIKNSEEIHKSPTRNYSIKTVSYIQNKADTNWDVTKVEVFDNKKDERIFEFFSNHGELFFNWFRKESIDYLVCAEDIYGGQTVIDLTNNKMESYSPNEDGFIATEFYLSPNGEKLAIIGCFWACPFIIKIYDFTNPLKLPFQEIKEIDLNNNTIEIEGWLDNERIITNQGKIITI